MWDTALIMISKFRGLFGRSFGRKLFISYVIIFLTLFLLTGFYVLNRLHDLTTQTLRDSLTDQVELISIFIDPAVIAAKDKKRVQDILMNLRPRYSARITLMHADGEVLGDSEQTWEELRRIDNHKERPEIREALRGGFGSGTRFSQTVRKNMLYVAIPVYSENQIIGVLRLAQPLTHVKKVTDAFQRPIFLVTAIMVGITLLFGFLLYRYVTRRIWHVAKAGLEIAGGNLNYRVHLDTDDELRMLGDAMNRMAVKLSDRIKEAEEEKRKMAVILENMSEGVIAVDTNRGIVIANASSRGILGLGEKQIQGKTLLEVIQNAKIDEMAETVARDGSNLSAEIEFFNGERKMLKVNVAGIRNPHGMIRTILVFHDVTQLRRLEKTRQEFVANVSHELRTPLTSIKGFIETLLAGDLKNEGQTKRFLEMMEEDASRLTRLINDLLEMSKIESNKVPLRLESLDLSVEIQKVLTTLMPEITARNILVRQEDLKGMPQVMADRDRLKQVLVNLIENAIKFNQDHGEIRFGHKLRGDQIEISVKDTGIGIPEDAVPRVFERFYRVDKARSREMGGTGLGLSIVKHIVEAHGGQVSCHNRPGEGSCFSFSLPLSS